MKQHLAPRDLALILAIVALWGFSFVPIKVGLREVPPFALAALRFFFAAIPLVFFVRRPRMPAGVVVGYGVAIGVFQFGLLFLGMKLGMPAGLSSIVIQVQVFFTIGLGIAFLGDRLRGEAREVVPVERDVDGAQRGLGTGRLAHEPGQPSGERDAAAAHADEGQPLRVGVPLQDLVGHPGKGASHSARIHESHGGHGARMLPRARPERPGAIR